MSEILISFFSIIFGIIATIVVSKHYYKKSFEKSITPYIQFYSSPLRGIDPEVRKELVIEYNHENIQELFEIQFLIANTGDKAIRDVISPLSLKIPKESNLLDATILHISPSERQIKLEYFVENKTIKFDMPLLNSGEFYIVKLLLDKEVLSKDFIFSIVADELPPILETKYLPSDAIRTKEKRDFEVSLFVIGIIITFLGLSLGNLIFNSWSYLPNIMELGLLAFLNTDLKGWSIILSCIPAFFLLLIGIVVTIGSFANFKFPSSNNVFVVPNDKQLLKQRIPFFYDDFREHI